MIFGNACECSNYECETNTDGFVCGGRGNCECNNGIFTCNCNVSSITGMRHYGDVCQCSSDHCVNPENTANGTCSGHGTCSPCEVEKACNCDDGYSGNYCQTYFDLGINNCGSADDGCIECYGEAAKDGSDAISVCNPSCQRYIALDNAESSNYQIPGTLNNTRECSHSTTECSYVYYVANDLSSGELVYAVEPRSCLPIPIWAIAVIIIVGLLIIGVIVLVIIKLCIMWLDYREYKRFMYNITHSLRNKDINTDDADIRNPIYEDIDNQVMDVLDENEFCQNQVHKDIHVDNPHQKKTLSNENEFINIHYEHNIIIR